MLYLILSIIGSLSVGVLLKIIKKLPIDIYQIIIINYISTVALSSFIFKPNYAMVDSNFPYLLVIVLGLLLPSIFIFQYLSIKHTGIIKTDIAQRMSLFIPIMASIFLFKENITLLRYISLFLGFIAVYFILSKAEKDAANINSKNILFLILVFVGFGVIDILFKQMALYSVVPYTTTLSSVFILALLLSLLFYGIFCFVKKIKLNITKYTLLFGVIIGVLNFGNIYFYLNAHKAFAQNPTIVFAGMNYGVIVFGTLIGYFGFKEKLSKKNAIGLILAIIAIALLMYSLK